MSSYIDIGANLIGSSFRDDLDDVLARAHQAGVDKIIVTGTDIEVSESAIRLCDENKGFLYSTVGMHPHHADDYTDQTSEQLLTLSKNQCVVAIGECGLDFNRNYSEPANQINAFEKQLEIALHVDKPLFLHQRDAHDDFMSMMKNYDDGAIRGVAHCFTGSADVAEDYLDMGLYIGITGWICDERRGQDLQQAVKMIPIDRILLETDAPYLLPRDLNQKPVVSRRNEPCFISHICSSTAKLMGVDADELASHVKRNSEELFGV